MSRMGEAQLQKGSAFLTRVWLEASRRMQKRTPDPGLWATRKRWIAELAPGNSWIDIGGMFGVAGDVSFIAEEAGATDVLLFDGMDPSEEFQAKHRDRNSKVRYQQADLHDPEDVGIAGQFDVVLCTGVIYHSPSPFQQLLHLRQMTKEELVLGTHVVPEVPGVENACVFYPGRGPDAEAAFAHAHGGNAARYPGMTMPFDTSEHMGYANMWWGLTPSAVRSMVRYAGFEITEEVRYDRFLMDLRARPSTELHSLIPPGFSRERGLERLEDLGGERPGWAPPPA
jgi:hypothetical protein